VLDSAPVFGTGRMLSEEELHQMALDIINVDALQLIDEICEVVINED
jgi:hypothetical protein